MERPTVVIAGASGFVGKALLPALANQYRLIGLTRNPPPGPTQDGIEWRHCDLFSLSQCEAALAGAQYAVYLVHSMLPSARLTQGNFQDMDLILADNFAQAAKHNCIRHIVYLGGLVPHEINLSEHLRSRLEVEKTLSSQGVPVTSLRAGMIFGVAGSSFNILVRMLRRAPIILLPQWTQSLTQPIALSDVVSLIQYCLKHPPTQSHAYDIGCPESMSYRDLLMRTAKLIGTHPRFIRMRYSSSLWWRYTLAWLVGAPTQLVLPLIQSMRHSMIAEDRRLQAEAGISGIPFDQAVRNSLQAKNENETWLNPFRRYWIERKSTRRDVRSVQRMLLPAGRSAHWAALEYIRWLPLFLRHFIRAEVDQERNLCIHLRFPKLLLLQLTYAVESDAQTQRQLFYVTGGILSHKEVPAVSGKPRLEFREALGGKVLLAAIHDYRPTLPWFIYNRTQALAHVWVMRKFAKHLRNHQSVGK